MHESPVASVVVPVFNNPEGLRTTLAAIEAQSTSAFEVIIVDDGSTVDLGEAVGGVGGQHHWRMVRTENRGAASARNTGAELATAGLLLFVDCRDEPVPSWIGSFAAVCGPGVGVARSGVRYRYRELRSERSDRPGLCVLPGTFAIRREVFAAIGGYDEALEFGENGDLLNRAIQFCNQNGQQLAFVDSELIVINDPANPRQYDRQRLEAMEWLLQRDQAALREDSQRRAMLASIGAVNAARIRDRRRSLRLACIALRAAPNDVGNWFRLGLCFLPHAISRAWYGRSDSGSGQLLGEPCEAPAAPANGLGGPARQGA